MKLGLFLISAIFAEDLDDLGNKKSKSLIICLKFNLLAVSDP